MAPHNPQSYVSTMASLHVDATTPSATIQESTLNRTPWVEELFDGSGPVIRRVTPACLAAGSRSDAE